MAKLFHSSSLPALHNGTGLPYWADFRQIQPDTVLLKPAWTSVDLENQETLFQKDSDFLDTQWFMVYYYGTDFGFQIHSTAALVFHGIRCHRKQEGLIHICQPLPPVGAVLLPERNALEESPCCRNSRGEILKG